MPDLAMARSQGRLLLYEPLETVDDGAASASSQGFFDVEDAPPWDTWFVYSRGSIFCWSPTRWFRKRRLVSTQTPSIAFTGVTGPGFQSRRMLVESAP